MSGASLVFWVILALCAIQSATFLALARFDPLNRAALWFAAAFAVAGLSFGGEIVLATGFTPGPTNMVIALTMMAAFLFSAYGLARHYRIELPAGGGWAIAAASTLLYYLILDLPRADFTRQMLYQLPYSLLSLLGLSIIVRARGKNWFDWALVVVMALLAIYFPLKPFLALWTGGIGDEPVQYTTTIYAALSTGSGAILLVGLAAGGLGLTLRDTAKRLIHRAERDAETGFLNRTGFAAHAERHLAALAERDGPAGSERIELALTLIAMDPVAPAGSAPMPVRELAALAADFAPRDALVGRMADVELAILAPGSNLFAARRAAEDLRKAASEALGTPARPVTLSVGITEREPGDAYADVLARGLWALNEANRAGGNCVRLAARSELGIPSIKRG